jgi:competence protein ComEA
MRTPATLQITVVGVALIVVVGSLIWFGMPSGSLPASGSDPVDLAPSADGRVAVHVSGAVGEPGLVELTEGSRIADAIAAAGGASADADLGGLNLASMIRDGDHIVVLTHDERAVSPTGGTEGIDLNRATASELEALPGVGPVLAQRIVDHRTEHGPFATVEDLLDVTGIGESKLASMREAIASP